MHTDPQSMSAVAAEPRAWFGYLVNQIGHRIRTETAEALTPIGISPALLRLMGIISVDQPITQTQLGLRAGMDRTSVTKFIDRLESLGIAERTSDAADRRVHAVLLTPAGRAALAAGTTAAEAVEASRLAPLATEERALLMDFLARIHGHHENICPDPDEETAR